MTGRPAGLLLGVLLSLAALACSARAGRNKNVRFKYDLSLRNQLPEGRVGPELEQKLAGPLR